MSPEFFYVKTTCPHIYNNVKTNDNEKLKNLCKGWYQILHSRMYAYGTNNSNVVDNLTGSQFNQAANFFTSEGFVCKVKTTRNNRFSIEPIAIDSINPLWFEKPEETLIPKGTVIEFTMDTGDVLRDFRIDYTHQGELIVTQLFNNV